MFRVFFITQLVASATTAMNDHGDASSPQLDPAGSERHKSAVCAEAPASPESPKGEFTIGQKIEVDYNRDGEFFPAIFKGPDRKNRENFVSVEYNDQPGKIYGVWKGDVRPLKHLVIEHERARAACAPLSPEEEPMVVFGGLSAPASPQEAIRKRLQHANGVREEIPAPSPRSLTQANRSRVALEYLGRSSHAPAPARPSPEEDDTAMPARESQREEAEEQVNRHDSFGEVFDLLEECFKAGHDYDSPVSPRELELEIDGFLRRYASRYDWIYPNTIDDSGRHQVLRFIRSEMEANPERTEDIDLEYLELRLNHWIQSLEQPQARANPYPDEPRNLIRHRRGPPRSVCAPRQPCRVQPGYDGRSRVQNRDPSRSGHGPRRPCRGQSAHQLSESVEETLAKLENLLSPQVKRNRCIMNALTPEPEAPDEIPIVQTVENLLLSLVQEKFWKFNKEHPDPHRRLPNWRRFRERASERILRYFQRAFEQDPDLNLCGLHDAVDRLIKETPDP